ncbi:glycoside hydrolase family 32 protein [Anaerococcus sp.]|uniref:glycoside hydrolase family 32 protein n=1 Tax=Anaerococcus TaxID=165779 RepID=UPI002901E6CF|nr:glycoside hydrolase family 32 protein [Anaerococcus sp.]MDU2565508.1 glycoside hydrolase family 32 protein [Anaerococcus sp.]
MYGKEFYENRFNKTIGRLETVKNDYFRLRYHISQKIGWLNDPNGLCQFDGEYHIYFQYDPFDASGKNIIWGHITTADFINYTYEQPFIFADSNLDKDGAYSGSAVIKDNKINFFYTGNVKYNGAYDYIYKGREHNTIKIVSDNGYNFDEKELLLSNKDYPNNMSCHVRDPKIYEENGLYYMFLGARSNDNNGLVLVYKSSDLSTFTYHMQITTSYDFGYMWECPDYFDINGKKYLLVCPQGLKSEEFNYQNVYQSGYFPIEIDLESKKYNLGTFAELDYGFDFYAPQTFEDKKGRRILIGWMGMPDASYSNPTIENYWQHCLTIPREIKARDNKILQSPIEELKALRKDNVDIIKYHSYEENIFEFISYNLEKEFEIYLRKDVKLIYNNDILHLYIYESGYGRNDRKVIIESMNNLRIFSDSSSIEIFVNDGEYVLSSRIYAKEKYFSSSIKGNLYKLKSINWN